MGNHLKSPLETSEVRHRTFSFFHWQEENLKMAQVKITLTETVHSSVLCEVLHLKQLSTWERRSLECSGFGSGKLLNDKVLYLELDKGRLKPPADSNAATEDERHPLLPAQIQQGSLSTKQLLLAFCSRKKNDCHMAASLFCGHVVLLCDEQKLISLGRWAVFHRLSDLKCTRSIH